MEANSNARGMAAPGRYDMAAIRQALMDNPDWVRHDPELMQRIAGTEAGGNVVDFNAVVRDRLLAENRRLKASREYMAETARANLALMGRTQVAALSLMDCSELADLDTMCVTTLPVSLGVDAVTVLTEGVTPLAGSLTIRPAAPGFGDQLLGDDNDYTGPVSGPTAQAVFGKPMGSQALARLDFEGVAGLLALGSRDEDMFEPGQGTEFLSFLARAMERRITPWLRD